MAELLRMSVGLAAPRGSRFRMGPPERRAGRLASNGTVDPGRVEWPPGRTDASAAGAADRDHPRTDAMIFAPVHCGQCRCSRRLTVRAPSIWLVYTCSKSIRFHDRARCPEVARWWRRVRAPP